MIWPDVEHGHIWGFVTLALIILILIIGACLESRLPDEDDEENDIP
jgi:Flp pilus assembly pilin Flp